MAIINENFLKLSNNYLFSEIAKRVKAFKKNYLEDCSEAMNRIKRLFN